MEEEIRHHLALKALEQGNLEAANRQFGNITLIKEDSRTDVARNILGTLRAGRSLRSPRHGVNKLFTAMAVLSLALGIGANTAIYSFMDAIMLRAMPVGQPGGTGDL